MKKNKLVLTFKSCDDWNRPVYECEGQLYVDVDPRKDRKPQICTKCNNEFYGEPDAPIEDCAELAFVPNRVVW